MPNDTLSIDQNGNATPLFIPGGTFEIVDGTSASAASAVISATNMAIVQLYATADCNIHVAASPTATTSTQAIPGKQLIYYKIRPGMKIAVLGAKLHVTTHNG